MPDALIFELLTNFLGNTFSRAVEGFFGIYLQNQMHPALEVKTEINLFVRPESRFKARQDIDDGRDNDDKNQNQSPRNIFQ
jgi:hypothetical protein